MLFIVCYYIIKLYNSIAKKGYIMKRSTSYIEINNLTVYAYHGVFPEENKKGQNFKVSAKFYLDMEQAAKTDDLTHSADYGSICQYINKLMNKKTFNLIEAAADYVAREVLLAFPDIERIKLKLSKPEAPVDLPFDDISVNITKGWHTAYIGLGSNMGDKRKYLDDAVKAINESPYCRVYKVSDFIVTKPYGYTEQDDFLNGAIEIKTMLSPYELLDFIQKIEHEAGRTREIHWGPRTLDLDILFYDDLVTADNILVIPHPEIEKRDFVLTPLKQIAPYMIHPLLNKRIIDIN